MSKSSENFYDILNLKKDCKAEDIKKSFAKLAKEFHPDKNSSKDAHNRFVRINEAYTTLSNPLKRKLYDDHLSMRGNVDYNQAAGREGPFTYRSYDYSSYQKTHGKESNNFNTGSRLITRLILLPKAVIVTALILMTFFNTGISFYFINDVAETQKRAMENESIMASLILERATRQAKLLGKEEQMMRLKEGKLGVPDSNELIEAYIKAKESRRYKSK